MKNTLKTWLLACLALPLLMLGGASAQVAQSSFPGAAGANLNSTAATTGGTWNKNGNYPNTFLLDGTGGIYNGGGSNLGVYRLSAASFPAGSGSVECNLYVASLVGGNSLRLIVYDSFADVEHAYQAGFYYEAGQSYSQWAINRFDSASSQTAIGGVAPTVFAAGQWYHLRFDVSPGSQVLRISPGSASKPATPYTGTYTTLCTAADSTYTASGAVGVSETAYAAGTPTTGFHLTDFLATTAPAPAPPRSPAAFYVDPVGGLDTNAGTSPGAAWQTASQAAGFTYVAGDRLYLKGGTTLAGSLVFPGLPPALITGYGTGAPTISAPAGQDAVRVTGFGSCTVAGLTLTGPQTAATITNGSTWTHGVAFALPSSQAVSASGACIQGCTITGFDVGISVWAKGTSAAYLGTSVTGNTVHDCPGNGIVVRGVEGTGGTPGTSSISYNHVYNIVGVPYGVDTDTTGCPVIATDQKNSTIEHNVLHDSGAGNTQVAGPGAVVCVNYNYSRMRYNESYGMRTGLADACAFDLDGGCQNSEVAYNYSHDNGGAGLFNCNFAPFVNTGNTFHNNISFGDGAQHNGSFQVDGPCSNFTVYANTIVQTKAGTPAIDINDGSSTGAFYNNLFVSSGAGQFFWWKATPSVGPSQFKFVGNDYYSPDSSALYSKIPGQTDQTTLTGFRTLGYETLTGLGQTGQSTSPLWAASALTTPPILGTYSVSGLRLYDIAPTSGAVGTGVPYALLGIAYSGTGATPPTEDYHGVALQPVPDIGAVTYPAGGYPVVTTPVITPPTGSILTLTLSRNSIGQPALAWIADSSATGYKILRSVDGVTYTVIGTAPAAPATGTRTYTDTTATLTQQYYYHVVETR